MTAASLKHSLTVLDHFKDSLVHHTSSSTLPQKEVQKAIQALECVSVAYSSSSNAIQNLQIQSAAHLTELVQALKVCAEHANIEGTQQSLVLSSIIRVESSLERFKKRGKKVSHVENEQLDKKK